MDDELKNFRETVLTRLRERDRRCEQFHRIFTSYNALSESLSHLMAKKGCSDTDSSTSSIEVESLKNELSDVYRKKAINDQQLIETNKKLEESEKKVAIILRERDAALKRIEELTILVETTRNHIIELKQDKQCLLDEHIALQTAYNALNERYLTADHERTDLINRLKELKNHEVAIINDLNDVEQQRSLERIRSALAEASKANPITDAKVAELTNTDNLSRPESYGDMIPERCKIRFECNEVGEVNDCLFHPNGRYLFSAGSDKKIRMWEISNDTCVRRAEFTSGNQAVTRIDIDPEIKHILGSNNDFAVRLWGLEDQRLKCALTGHSDRVTSAKFFSNGRSVCSGSNDRTLKIWDISLNRCQRTFFPGSTILDVATNDYFGPPIISGHFDKSVRFWDPRSEVQATKIHLDGKVTSLYLSASKQTVLCSARDETLTLLDLRNYGTLHIYSAEQYRTSSDFSKCVISPCDTYIAAGSADGHVFIWNLLSTRLEKVLYKGGHENAAVLCIAWNPTGSMILSGDKRKTLCLWR